MTHSLFTNPIIMKDVRSTDTYGQRIEICYSALTGEVSEIFYGISLDDDIDDL